MAIQTVSGVATQYGGSLIAMRILSGSGTYTPSGNCNMIDVVAIGAGGGGGGVKGVILLKGVSAGGSSGGFSRKLISPVVPGLGYAYSVGAGGTGGAGASPAAGADGGSTTFGSVLTCPGGMGAPGVTADSGAAAITYPGAGIGAAATGGDFNSAGIPGGMGWNFVTLGLAFGSDCVSGAGGDRPHYGSGGPSIRGGSSDGNTGVGYGGGGGGATTNGVTARAGGAGMDGVIIVSEYS